MVAARVIVQTMEQMVGTNGEYVFSEIVNARHIYMYSLYVYILITIGWRLVKPQARELDSLSVANLMCGL